MNVDADALAESFCHRMEAGFDPPKKDSWLVPLVDVSVLVKGCRLTSHYSHKIRVHIQGKKHQHHLQKKFEWSNRDWNSLDWSNIKAALAFSEYVYSHL